MTESELNHNIWRHSNHQNETSMGGSTDLSPNENHIQRETNVMLLQGKHLEEFPTLNSEQEKCTKHLYLDYNTINHIPEPVFHTLNNLVTLSIVGNDVEHIPESVCRLNNLEELYLNENELSSLPDSISKLTNLRKLNIVGNRLKSLPKKFGDLTKLRELYAHENLIEELPDNFSKLSDLKVLELADNKLQTLPTDFGKLISLETLNVNGNKLTALPMSFSELPNLKQLDLSDNSLQCLPDTFASAAVLEKLFFAANYVVWWPEWMGAMPRLQELAAEDNRLTGDIIPADFGHNCQELRVLNLAGNYITHLPDSIGNLVHLESLHMGSCIDELERRAYQNGNRLVALPDSFCRLSRLRHLRLDENKLEHLPEDIGQLLSLEHLDLGQNHLRALPTSFCELRVLNTCQLSRNQLETLPDCMDLMSGLRSLRLDNNLISILPSSLGELTGLETLDLFNNNLTAVPTFLHKLTSLKRLDLLENKFKLKHKEIPRVLTNVKYPTRDPNLKGTWRGRAVGAEKREGDNNELEEDGMDDEEQSSDSEPEYTENQLEIAMRRNLSLWRSHTGPAKREKFTQPDTTSRSESPSLSGPVSQPSGDSQAGFIWRGSDIIEGDGAATWGSEKFGEENWDDDLNVVPVENDVTKSAAVADPDPWGSLEEQDVQCSEDLEKLPTENGCTDPRYRYVPCEAHPSNFDRAARAAPDPEDGQFDDVDDLSDC